MSSISGGSGIPPITPNVYSPTNSLAARTLPLSFDASAVSEQNTISMPPPTPSVPTLPLAEYYLTVNQAAIRQKIQEFLDSFNDATKLKGMWQDAIDQAIALKDFIKQIYQIVDLQNDILQPGQIENARDAVNLAIDIYNAGVTGPGGDQEQAQILNNAIIAYNNASTDYQNALQNLNGALANQQSALGAYNTATQDWDAAMASYLAGTLDQAGLEAARAQFNTAKGNFDNAQVNYDAAKSLVDTTEANLSPAAAALETAKDNYNAYVQTRSPQIDQANNAINDWNNLANQRNLQIAELNALRATLNPPLPPVPFMPIIPPINALEPFTIPTGTIPTIATDINNGINDYNNNAGTLNGFIGTQVNGHVATVNGTGYIPPLDPVAFAAILAQINQIPVSSIAVIPIPMPIAHVDYTPFTPVDVVTIYLLPRLTILDQLKKQ